MEEVQSCILSSTESPNISQLLCTSDTFTQTCLHHIISYTPSVNREGELDDHTSTLHADVGGKYMICTQANVYSNIGMCARGETGRERESRELK